MAGFTNIGAIEALPDHAGASLVDRPLSLMREAIKRLVLELGPDIIGDDPDVIAAAVAAVDSAVAGLNLLPVTRGTLPDGTDLNSVNSTSMAGVWRLAASNAYLNLPPSLTLVGAAVLVVARTDNGNGVSQQIIHERREFWRKSNLPTTWWDWAETAKAEAVTELEARALPSRGRLPDGTNLDDVSTIYQAGAWQLALGFTYTGLPEGVVLSGSSTLEVVHSYYTASIVQRLTTETMVFTRSRASSSAWGPWIPISSARGTLPSMNVDELWSIVWSGTWHLAAVNTYTGMPDELVISEACVLRVDAGNSLNAVTQTLTHQTPTRFDRWERELFIAPNSNQPEILWHPWKRIPTADEIADLVGDGGGIVRSGQITTIVASTDAGHPITDGDLLVVYT